MAAAPHSLLVALASATAIGYGTHHWYYDQWGSNADILGACIGTLVIYIYAVLDGLLKLNLLSRLARQVIIVLIPPLALIFLVLGTIFIGIATPTEGGAMGALGALLLALFRRRLTFGITQSALIAPRGWPLS